MAKMQINPAFDEYLKELALLEEETPEISKKVVIAGANPVTDEIRKKIETLPEETFRKLKDEEKFLGVPKHQKKDLLDSLGYTPPGIDKEGNTNVKVGFDGYGSFKTKKYPKGLPNPLLARAIESGSSVRQKRPFVRKATNTSRPKAIEAMENEIAENIKKIMKG